MSKKPNKPAKPLAQTFVYVVCKAPLGILAEIGDKGQPTYRKVLFKGANEGTFNPRDGRFTPTTVGGFGLTQVEFAFWNDWKAANKAFVAEYENNKLLAAFNSKDEADAYRIEHADSVSGFEPLDPSKMPKGLEPASTGQAV